MTRPGEEAPVSGVTVAGLAGVRAAIFDFNGTITDDEDLQYEIYAGTFADLHGVVLERATYYDELAGRSDPAIVSAVAERASLDLTPAERKRLLAERVRRYAERVAAEPPVRPGAAALVRDLSACIPLALGTGAFRSEVELILREAGLYDCFTAIVTAEDVTRGKPHPETFSLALSRLNQDLAAAEAFAPGEVAVFEDSVFGVAAAQAAGMRCVVAPLTTDGIGAAGGSADVVVVESLHPGLLTTRTRGRHPLTH